MAKSFWVIEGVNDVVEGSYVSGKPAYIKGKDGKEYPLRVGFHGYENRGEADAALKGQGATETKATKSADKKENNADSIVDSKKALENLKKVKVECKDADGKIEKYTITDDAVMERWTETKKLVYGLFEKAYTQRIDVTEFSGRSDVKSLMENYGMNLDDVSCFDSMKSKFDVVAFVDGGGNKVPKTSDVLDLGIEGEAEDFISTKIVFGVVFCDLKAGKISLYRYVMERALEFKYFFRQSNVAGEELAALLAMYICKKEGKNRLAIFQDNNLPMKYYSGEFKVSHKWDDAPLHIFVNDSIEYLKNAMEINFVKILSEHEGRKDKKKRAEEADKYESQNVAKPGFEEAEFFNGISDRLADYNIE